MLQLIDRLNERPTKLTKCNTQHSTHVSDVSVSDDDDGCRTYNQVGLYIAQCE